MTDEKDKQIEPWEETFLHELEKILNPEQPLTRVQVYLVDPRLKLLRWLQDRSDIQKIMTMEKATEVLR